MTPASENRLPTKLAVLVSGGGTTLINLLENINAGTLAAEVVLVIASNDDAANTVRQKLNAHGSSLPVHTFARKTYDSTNAFSDAIFTAVRDAGAELVCLAGFLSLLVIPEDYSLKVLNIHPALLPAFGGKGMYGHHVHEAVLAAGCKVSGCTVHFADNTYDTGPILLQKCVPVLDNDTAYTLAERVFDAECAAYPEAINLIASGRITVENGLTRLT